MVALSKELIFNTIKCPNDFTWWWSRWWNISVFKGPDGKLRKGIIKPTKDSGTYVLTFTPDIVGVYNVQILSGETCLTNTPFKVRAIPAGDAQKCYIKGCFRF